MLVLPSHIKQGTKKFTVSLQRRLGLYVSCAASYYNAMEAEGNKVTVCDRLGDTLTHKGNGQTPHKWVCVAWRQAEANATYSQVLLGDKGNGLKYYDDYNNTYIPDLMVLDDDPRLDEVKNYSSIVHPSTNKAPHNKVTTLNGHEYLMGNTEERLKHEVLGTRQRNSPALGPFDHRTGLGFVPKHDGDYRDAINNRKASVLLLVHEIFGGMSLFASRHLRRLGRRAAEEGTDSTDYSQSYTAASFVSYYAQRISNNIVMYGADGFLKQLGKVVKTRAKGRNSASSI